MLERKVLRSANRKQLITTAIHNMSMRPRNSSEMTMRMFTQLLLLLQMEMMLPA